MRSVRQLPAIRLRIPCCKHCFFSGRVRSGKKSEPSVSSKESTRSSGLYKPNTISDAKLVGKGSIVSHQPKVSPPSKQRTMDSFPESTEYYAIYEKPRPPTVDKAALEKEKRESIMAKSHYVEEPWNFSPQCQLLGHYQKDLQDCYPRDPITKLPHRHAAPKYLATHKNVPISAFSDSDAYKRERRVVFQPETILDAQTKTKYSEDTLQNKPQVFLNLCNDMGSQMFQSK